MRQRAHLVGNAVRVVALAVAAWLSVATSPPRYTHPRNYPVWRIDATTLRAVGCGQVRAWVAKSGKTGMGITIELSPVSDAPCTARVTSAEVVVAGRRVPAAQLPPLATATPGQVAHLYVAFAWDNQADWNDGVRVGSVSFAANVGGHAATWTLPMTHHYSGPHYTKDRAGKSGTW